MLKPLLLLFAAAFPQAQIEPPKLVYEMQTTRPLVLCVGFPVLYRAAHIRGAVLAGPASKHEGLQALESATNGIARSRPIVIYCGCCPWDKCPNIHPAYDWLQQHGFTNVQVLHIATNLHTDWVAPGYPTGKAQ